MEGKLYKWTNYLLGWQPRWFVLEKGILSYYSSDSEVELSSKGSFKASALEITVSTLDNTRFDLSIPPGRVLYLRTSSSEDRVRWLDLLFAAQMAGRSEPRFMTSSPALMEYLKSDLRMYAELLSRQVALLKSAASRGTEPDLDNLWEGSRFLSETCSKFLNTIDSCLEAHAVTCQAAVDLSEESEQIPTDLSNHTLKPNLN